MSKRDQSRELRPRGFYPTPRSAILPLLPYLQNVRIGEPCAGDGSLCDVLFEFGHTITYAADIVPADPRVRQLDAMECNSETILQSGGVDVRVTNPPWPEPRQRGEPTLGIMGHLLDLRPGWFLLSSDFMHNVCAGETMRSCCALVSVGRVKWIPGTGSSGFDNCAWYYFDKHATGDVRIKFFPNAGRSLN